MSNRHWILLPVQATPERARQIAEEVAWSAAEQDWSADKPLVVDETQAIISITGWDRLHPVEPELG